MIRQAKITDLDEIMNIAGTAKKYMADHGNKNQWTGDYPSREVFSEDIKNKSLYVCENTKGLYGVFAFILGEEPSYSYIEEGQWLNTKPYGTIHRIASNGAVRGVFAECFDFCRNKSDNIRIDTHQDNHTMQHLVEKNGFHRCGIIYIKSGAKRIAYQYEEIKKASKDL